MFNILGQNGRWQISNFENSCTLKWHRSTGISVKGCLWNENGLQTNPWREGEQITSILRDAPISSRARLRLSFADNALIQTKSMCRTLLENSEPDTVRSFRLQSSLSASRFHPRTLPQPTLYMALLYLFISSECLKLWFHLHQPWSIHNIRPKKLSSSETLSQQISDSATIYIWFPKIWVSNLSPLTAC